MMGQTPIMMTSHGPSQQRPPSMDGLHRLPQHHPTQMVQTQENQMPLQQPGMIQQQQQHHPNWPQPHHQQQQGVDSGVSHRPTGTSIIHKTGVVGGHSSGHMIGIPLSEAMMSPAVTNGNFPYLSANATYKNR